MQVVSNKNQWKTFHSFPANKRQLQNEFAQQNKLTNKYKAVSTPSAWGDRRVKPEKLVSTTDSKKLAQTKRTNKNAINQINEPTLGWMESIDNEISVRANMCVTPFF